MDVVQKMIDMTEQVHLTRVSFFVKFGMVFVRKFRMFFFII